MFAVICSYIVAVCFLTNTPKHIITAPPPPPLPTNKFPQSVNNKENLECLDDNKIKAYEPGHATEMLAQSVLNLKIDDNKEHFKAEAGKILTGMLEARLNEKNALLNGQNGQVNQTKKGKTTLNGNNDAINGRGDQMTVNIKLALNAQTHANASDASPTLSDLPPPPSPSELIVANVTNDFSTANTDSISDINDNRILATQNNVDGFSVKVAVAPPVHATHHDHHQQHHQQTFQNGQSGLVYRNKNTKPELTTHARDRRSYIGNDNYNQNRFVNHNNNLIKSHTTEIASDLRDGKHPVCSVCHVKITR